MTDFARAVLPVWLVAVVAAACGSAVKREAAPIPTPIGRGPEFMPPAVGSGPSPTEVHARPSHRPGPGSPELFARRRVVVIPANIGVREGCRYPLRTLTPTGVVELDRRGTTVGDLFAVWRMPLSGRRLLTFRGTVTAYVGGERWTGDVRAIPVSDEAEIVLEIGGYIRPHRFYLFPPR